MAKDRIYGEDKEFMSWCRLHPDLPSFSRECGWVQTDVDTFVHRYMTTFDGQGTREFQCMMEIEVKTRSGMPSPSQEDTLRKKHLCTKAEIFVNGQTVKNFGVTVVSMDGVTPDDSGSIEWCRFDQSPPHDLKRASVTVQQFVELIRFDRHPDTLATKPFRRHHATRSFVERTVVPLGWEDERLVVHRS
jgi:hypothetical protein